MLWSNIWLSLDSEERRMVGQGSAIVIITILSIMVSLDSEERRMMGQGAAKSFKRKSMMEPRWRGQCWAWWAPEGRYAQDDTPWLVLNIKWEDTLVSMQPPLLILLPPPASFFWDPEESEFQKIIVKNFGWVLLSVLYFLVIWVFFSYLGISELSGYGNIS